MPSYAYTARDGSGALTAGTLLAGSVDEVTRMLRADGRFPTGIHPAESAEAPAESGADVKVPRTEIIQFATELAIMIETGVTITEALDSIAQQTDRPQLKKMVADVSRMVQSGSDLSTALSRHPRSFPVLFIAMIRASEKSGMMAKLLNRGAAYLRDEHETIRRVKGALTYPLVMLGFCLTTTTFLLAFVLPRFAAIYAAKQAALPVPTKILMAISYSLTGHYILAPSLAVGIAGTLWFYFRTASGMRMWHYLQLQIPLLSPMFRKLHLSRGLRMVGTMSGAGVTLVDSVEIAKDLTPNTYFRKLWADVSESIQAGRPLSEPMFNSPLVPRSVSQMLHSGEKSGKLSVVMEQVATFSETELKEKITDLTRYIEPAMIAVMGFIIGGVALAMLLPIFSIGKVMAQ